MRLVLVVSDEQFIFQSALGHVVLNIPDRISEILFTANHFAMLLLFDQNSVSIAVILELAFIKNL